MITALFDMNNMLFRSAFTAGGYGSKGLTYETDEECKMLVRKLGIDISYILQMVKCDNVVFCADSSSWRKDIDIDENNGYKAHRVKSENYNWTNIFKHFQVFLDIVQQKGVIVTQIDKAEGDDCITLWTERLLKDGHNVVIISGDEDVRQLVKSHYNNQCVVYNPILQGRNAKRKLYFDSSFEQWLSEDDVDIFNMSNLNDDKIRLKTIFNNPYIVNSIVDKEEILYKKIFCGDDGDNVPSVYSWLNTKGVQKRVTKSVYQKIKETVPFKEPVDLEGENVSSILKKCLEDISKTEIKLDMKQRIHRQRILVELNSDLFPGRIVESFNDFEYPKIKTSKLTFKPSTVKMDLLLEGTTYVDSNYKKAKQKEKESDIFKMIDDMVKDTKSNSCSLNLLDL